MCLAVLTFRYATVFGVVESLDHAQLTILVQKILDSKFAKISKFCTRIWSQILPYGVDYRQPKKYLIFPVDLAMNGLSNEEQKETKQGKQGSFGGLSLEKLGALIAAKRTSMNMSQEELGLRSGIHRSYISEIERGQRNFTIKVLAQIAECLSLSMSQLMKQAGSGADDAPE